MSELFLKIVNMSISASWLVLAVLILRLILRKAPKWTRVWLWGLAAVRLICPFSLKSALSLIPSAETISPEIMMDASPTIESGIDVINRTLNPMITQSFAPDPLTSANPLQIWIPVLAVSWAAGMAVMLAYTVISYWQLCQGVRTAVLLHDNIFQSEHAGSPFVLGILRPKIYLSFNIEGKTLDYVIAHEQAHIRRKDHWWKPLGFLILAVHWFNPLIWLAYILLCRDIEFACDEKVIRELGISQRADYSQALLVCSVNRRAVAACPLAFGEISVKKRVKSVLNYRKPSFPAAAAAVLICILAAVCFLTDPPAKDGAEAAVNAYSLSEEKSLDAAISNAVLTYYASDRLGGLIHVESHVLLDSEEIHEPVKEIIVYLVVLQQKFSMDDGVLEEQAGSYVPTAITFAVSETEEYTVVDYWEPRDGSYYAVDIRNKFPEAAAGKALDSQDYIGELETQNYNKALGYMDSAGEKAED